MSRKKILIPLAKRHTHHRTLALGTTAAVWTCGAGSRGSASLPLATASANQIVKPRVSSPRCSLYDPRRGSNPRLLCLTNVYFGQQCFTESASLGAIRRNSRLFTRLTRVYRKLPRLWESWSVARQQ